MYRAIAVSTIVAAALAFSVPAGAQSNQKNITNPGGTQANAKFCHQQTTGSQAKNCIYASMDACQKIAKAQGGSCVPNTGATTGSGSSSGSMKGSSGMKDKKN